MVTCQSLSAGSVTTAVDIYSFGMCTLEVGIHYTPTNQLYSIYFSTGFHQNTDTLCNDVVLIIGSGFKIFVVEILKNRKMPKRQHFHQHVWYQSPIQSQVVVLCSLSQSLLMSQK